MSGASRYALIMRPVLLFCLVLALVLALLVTLLWLGQRRLIYLPDTTPVPSLAEIIPEGRDVTLTTSDGLALGAWYLPAGEPARDLTVLVAGGNGGNRQGRLPLARALSAAGYAVLLFDYRGYGGNPGRPTETGLAADARAARAHLVDELRVPPARLIYFGESLGCGVVTELATEYPPAGLVLRSPFTDLAAAAEVHYPFLPADRLLRDRFPVAERLATIDAPVAVVLGTADSIVPPAQSREVADRAAGPVLLTEIAGAGHNDPVMFGSPELVSAVDALADLIGRSSPN